MSSVGLLGDSELPLLVWHAAWACHLFGGNSGGWDHTEASGKVFLEVPGHLYLIWGVQEPPCPPGQIPPDEASNCAVFWSGPRAICASLNLCSLY